MNSIDKVRGWGDRATSEAWDLDETSGQRQISTMGAKSVAAFDGETNTEDSGCGGDGGQKISLGIQRQHMKQRRPSASSIQSNEFSKSLNVGLGGGFSVVTDLESSSNRNGALSIPTDRPNLSETMSAIEKEKGGGDLTNEGWFLGEISAQRQSSTMTAKSVVAFDGETSGGDSKSQSSTSVSNSAGSFDVETSEEYQGDDRGVGQKKSLENRGQYGIQRMASTGELLERTCVTEGVPVVKEGSGQGVGGDGYPTIKECVRSQLSFMEVNFNEIFPLDGLGGVKLEELVPTRRGGNMQPIKEIRNSDMGRDESEGGNQEKEGGIWVKKSEALLKGPGVDIHKFQGMSNLTATGHTLGTSYGSPITLNVSDAVKPASNNTAIKSDDNSASKRNDERSTQDRGRNFDAIKEEVKNDSEDAKPWDRKGFDVPSVSTHNTRRFSRFKKIRKSLMGNNSGQSNDGRQQERWSVLPQLGHSHPSHRSLSSACTTFSDIARRTEPTSSSKEVKGAASRFGLKKVQSMLMINTADGGGSSSRQILLVKTQRNSSSNVSIISSQSNASRAPDDGNNINICPDIYDDSDHAQAMSSLVGKALVRLSTLDEPPDEQKRDEDYHMSAYNAFVNDSTGSDNSTDSFYRFPSHRHLLVRMRPSQLFPESPGWQCDECLAETFDLDDLAYISTELNYVICKHCFAKGGFPVDV